LNAIYRKKDLLKMIVFRTINLTNLILL